MVHPQGVKQLKPLDQKLNKPQKNVVAKDLKNVSKPSKGKIFKPTTIHIQPQPNKKLIVSSNIEPKQQQLQQQQQKQDVEVEVRTKPPIKKEAPKELGKRSKILKHNQEQIGNQLNSLVEYLRGELS